MNICFFSQEYPPETHVGGIGTYTYNMAGALAKMGHTIHVITSTQHQDRTFQDNGIWVHRIRKCKSRIKELSIFNYSYSAAKKLSEIDCRFDIVQSSEFGSEAFWYAFHKKQPLVTRLATPYFLIEKMNGKAFLGPRPLFNWMEKKQTLRSDGIFASTKAIAKEVTEHWRINPSRVEIIPNSIDVSRIVRIGEIETIQDILKNKNYLLYFGRLEERKGVHILSQALPDVFGQFPDIYMVFAGSDSGYRGLPMREYIKRSVHKYSGNVIFLDNLPHEKLFPVVKSAKMVILPSLWEAFGFVCVEALALGRPVIATSGSGFEEIIEDNISGYLVEPGNSELLAGKIINVLKDEEGLRQISEGARERAQDFEVSKVALKLLTYYEKTGAEWLRKRGN